LEDVKGERSLGRPHCRWDDDVKIDLKEIDVTMWTGLNYLMMTSSCGLL
jgi:hypothetical protein